MSSPSCYSVVDVCAERTAVLGAGGAPTSGATHGYVTNAMQKLQVGVAIETGQEFTEKNGCGDIAATHKEPDKIKRTDLTMDLVTLDLILLNQMGAMDLIIHTGSTPTGSAGTPAGWELPAVGATGIDYVSLEAWSYAKDGDSFATPPLLGTAAAHWHWVFPFTNWTLGQFTLTNGITVFSVTGVGTENASMPATGPFGDWPTDISAAGGMRRIGGAFFDAAIPTPACATIAVP